MAYVDPFSIDSLATELIREHAKLAKATEHFDRLKYDLLKQLQLQNIGTVNVPTGTITVCTRTGKDYGHTVKVIESTLKAEKARLDHLGEFIIKSVTHYLRIG